jgi:hypothetical protein
LSKTGDNVLNVSADAKSDYASNGKIDLIQIQVADKVEEHVKNFLSNNLKFKIILN